MGGLPTNHSSDGSPESGNGLFKRIIEEDNVPQNLKDIFKISNRNRKKNKEKKKEKIKKMKSDLGQDGLFSCMSSSSVGKAGGP